MINPKNSKTSDPHRLILLHPSDKIDLKNVKNDKGVAISNLSIYYTFKDIKQ